MHSQPRSEVTPLVSRIAAFFAAVGGTTLLLERFGVSARDIGSLFALLLWPALGVWALTDISLATARSQAAQFLFRDWNLKGKLSELSGTVKVAGFFLVLFAILLWKNIAYLKSQFDIRWHIAFLNYDLAWHTPILSLAGNILYQFEIQPPFNSNLAPLNGIVHFVSPEWQIVASYVLFYLAMSALLWAIGWTVDLRPVPRTICAALAALITTIPWGLDHLLPFLPPPFVFVSQAMLTRIYEELGILSLTTALLFFWIGQPQRLIPNVTIGLGFAIVCYIVLLAYPALAVFSTPVIVFYCGAFLLTATDRRELWWKLAVSGIFVMTMLATRIPLFFKNLYSYTYGAYFSDRIMNGSRLTIWKNSTVLGVFWPDPKVVLLCLVSFASAVFFVVRGPSTMRRFAIAMLLGEAGAVATGGIMAYLHYPVSLYYSDQLQAPLLIFFFVVPLLFVTFVLSKQCDEVLRKFLERANKGGKLVPFLGDRRAWYAAMFLLCLAVSPLLIPRQLPFLNSVYPPAEPPSVQILKNELGLAPGKPFAGRVLTIVGQDLTIATTSDMNPLLSAVLNVLEDHYGRYTGNNHWTDLLNFNVPVVGEYGQWATPIDFLLMREFFGRKEDIFQKSLFILRAYSDRVAHMIGIRYVITDAANIPGGTLVYRQMAGNMPLQLFRIDGINLGQYSPTRPIRITTAAEGLSTIKSAAFDPEQDALVEQDLPVNLVPGKLQSLTVESGPTLHVQAESAGASLLVLPFEYSHCLRLIAVGNTSARLLPVNLQQTGLLFDRHANVEITFSFGPLAQPACRSNDLTRMHQLHVREALD